MFGRHIDGKRRRLASPALVGAALVAATATANPEPAHAASATREAVVNAAESYLGTPYQLRFGWTCATYEVDCECLNRHAIWDGTKTATGHGLQLHYTLWGQIQGEYTGNTPYTYWNSRYLQKGDLVFWDINEDGYYGGDYDHTGVYVGGDHVIDANAYYGEVRYDTITLNGTEKNPLFVDVLAANGYGN